LIMIFATGVGCCWIQTRPSYIQSFRDFGRRLGMTRSLSRSLHLSLRREVLARVASRLKGQSLLHGAPIQSLWHIKGSAQLGLARRGGTHWSLLNQRPLRYGFVFESSCIWFGLDSHFAERHRVDYGSDKDELERTELEGGSDLTSVGGSGRATSSAMSERSIF